MLRNRLPVDASALRTTPGRGDQGPARAQGPAWVREHAPAMMLGRLLHSVSHLGRLHPASRPSRHNVERIENMPYVPGGGPEHQLDIYRPAGPARRGQCPVLLYIHGGGFCALSKDTHWLMGLLFARAGYLVCNISYRLAPRHPFPAAIEDTCAAFEWVVRHAADHGGDVERLVVAGESAGANLATALTLATCIERPEPWARRVHELALVPAATIPFCGLLEVSDPERFGRRRPIPPWITRIISACSAAYLHGTALEPDGDPDAPGPLDLANPLTTLERLHARGDRPRRPLPPFFAPVGTRDPLLDDTRRLARVLDDLGVPCEAAYYPGEIHAFQALVWREQARRLWRDTLDFLQRHVE